MKKITCIILLQLCALATISYGQRTAVELTFTGIKDTSYLQPVSIKIKNMTQGGDTVLYYPDTVLLLNYVGIGELPGNAGNFSISPVYPNPVTDRATLGINIPATGLVSMAITDVVGRRVLTLDRMLEKGYHTFSFTTGDEKLYFFTARWQGNSRSVKILNTRLASGMNCSLEYTGSIQKAIPVKSGAEVTEFPFSPGDMLMFIGYTDTLQSGFIDSPEESNNYVFQFASDIPCPGLDSLEYEGKWYHTVQVFSQCWLKENLDVGTKIPSTQTMADNGILEKYCYANLDANCDKTGGLYTWEEMMQYTTTDGGRGICPGGWHIPTDEEWKVLEGTVDGYYRIGNVVWNGLNNFRGTDAGFNLKSTEGWSGGGNGSDKFEFTGKGGGYWWQNSFFEYTNFGIWWTSTSNNAGVPYYRGVRMDMDKIFRNLNTYGSNGYSVRCLKD
jgi:uncharacterized protein (TIGR02145 family)